MKDLLKQKSKALGIHLIISFILAVICLLLINHLWYPSPLFNATGVKHLYFTMLGVDLILGPLLTFIIYKKGKETLKMDLIVVALIQLSAIFYGMYSMYQGRPVWITYVVDRFELVRANEILDEEKKGYKLPLFGPEYHFADVKTNKPNDQLDIFLQEAGNNISPAARMKFHKDFTLAKPLIIEHTHSIEDLDKYNDKNSVDAIISKYPQSTGYLPLKASNEDMSVLVDKKNGGKVVKIVDLRPWK